MAAPSEKEDIEAKIREAEKRALEMLRGSPEPTVALPAEDLETIREVNAILGAYRALRSELGREPTNEEIARRSSIPVERVARAMSPAPPPIKIG